MDALAQTQEVTKATATTVNKYADIAINYASEYGLKLLGALLIFFIGKWVVKKVTKVIKAFMHKANVDKTLIEFGSSLIYFLLLLMVVMASLNALGVNTTSFIAVLGAASLAVGLALQGTLSNIGAAVLIIVFRPFKVGDVIDAGGATGKVSNINLFSTIITPADNRAIIIPNSAIIAGNITNFTSQSERRVDLTFGIGYGDDLKLAKETLMQIISSHEKVLAEPEPFVAVSALAESSVNFTVRAWVKTDDYWDVYFDLTEKVKLAFDEKGISIPFPQMDIHQK
ncbi:MAG: mechanosensitive ion channel [Sulfurimonas sp.]|nr:mechanosensitive ion channel [Sulfurimonas sp.]MBU3938448.1 mechanosensitive ion channel [bacterium]MBU4025471.1 mechanosensitive ion channel [bacterium]MBU4059193.1 mechanosensitive ion channel [bacterium]MBU4111424.1 mechanosensitive ion channel [bacterium]